MTSTSFASASRALNAYHPLLRPSHEVGIGDAVLRRFRAALEAPIGRDLAWTEDELRAALRNLLRAVSILAADQGGNQNIL